MKKLIYGLGALATITAPVVAVVSCGSKSKETQTGFATLSSIEPQIAHVNEKLAWNESAPNVSTNIVLTLTHEETVNFFKGLDFLKDGDNTSAALHRIKSETRTEATTETPTGVTEAQVKAAQALPFQNAIESFLKSNADHKIDKFLKDAYAKNSANTKALPLAMLDAQFHAEGYGLDATQPSGKTQGVGGYSFLSFKIKVTNSETQLFRDAFVGKQILSGENLVKFNDTVYALKKAFDSLSRKSLADLKAMPEA